jgi:AraC-like DNA-binding protein/quercetin dioxygenase-like cupin family protein
MSPNRQTAVENGARPAVIVARFPMPAGSRFDWHTHTKHQLAWSPDGVITVETQTATFVLPPTRALWIPARVRHEVRAAGGVEMRALYIRPRNCRIRWKQPTAVAIGPLTAELIGYLDDAALSRARQLNAEAVLIDLLEPIPVATVEVRLPPTPPARTVASALIARPSDRSTLAQWGRRVGASERTLARSFLAGSGVSFGRWRTLARLQSALPRLGAGAAVSVVAEAVGYDTASAFVAAFRRETGVTPAAYFRLTPKRG